METIGKNELWSFFDPTSKIQKAKNGDVRKGSGNPVRTYLELANKVAELQFVNRDYVFFFRGQNADYRNAYGNTSLKPSLFRPTRGTEKVPNKDRLGLRFDILKEAERVLNREYAEAKFQGLGRLQRQRILRWALLQHYEICKTPLLDVTNSLRIAASFASIDADQRAYIFVLGVPNLSGAVTASAEGGLQIIRLASVCPPSAVRPHIQEGYLLGEYPDMADFSQKENYFHYEIDFGRRLIAKFSFVPSRFWSEDTFPMVPKQDLYPDAIDPLFALASKIKQSLVLTEN